jgi:hypothetical protein
VSNIAECMAVLNGEGVIWIIWSCWGSDVLNSH